jgi:hypothetical protein
MAVRLEDHPPERRSEDSTRGSISFLSLRGAVSREILAENLGGINSPISLEKGPWGKMGSVGHDDGKIRAEKRAQAALLAFFHLLALRRKISLGVHLLGLLQHLGRAELDADPATFAVLLFYV